MDIEKLLYNNPLSFYEAILLGPLTQVYSAKKMTIFNDWQNYGNLLIDKFSIHSASFYHLSEGIIEHKGSTEKVKITGYDLFTVNALFRVMLETYTTFNHIFVSPTTYEEKEFRFLLWKIDGYYEKLRFKIDFENIPGLKDIQDKDQMELAEMIDLVQKNSFCKDCDAAELLKIYDPAKRKISWRFKISENNKICPLNITDLLRHVCKTDAFINTYRYSSVHAHSNFISIEHFEKTRSIPITKDYTDPITRLAIYLTAMLIQDICIIDKNAEANFTKLPNSFREFITGINQSIRKSK